MEKLAERLVWARARAQLTQQELAKKSGVGQSTIASWESGARETGRKISVVADALGVNPLWLAEGRGEAIAGVVHARASATTDEPDTLYRLPYIGRGTRVSVDGATDEEMIPIKRVTLQLEAGFPGFEADRDFEDGGVINLPRKWIEQNDLVPQCLIAIKVHGASMEPMFFEDDVVVVNIADTKPVSGNVYAINFNGQAMVKQMVLAGPDWWLHSFNPAKEYSRVMCRGGECIVIGRVVHQSARSLIGRL